MQGLSSRAHAFSVEALVGKPCKRRRLADEQLPGEPAGLESTRRSPEEPSEDAGPRTSGGGGEEEEEAEPGGREAGSRDGEVRVELQGSELWKRFYEIGTEMIITKAGRRMFPSVRVKVRNLDPCRQYYIAMDVTPVDSKRYRYVYHSSQWMVAGNTDHSCISPRLYVHPDSPCAGETWMRQVVSFDRVKLTNNEMDDKGHIILQSMHKYRPRVHVIQHDPRMDLSQIRSLPADGVFSFSFPETEFTTVTAYQNQQITKLKIDRNPFAKGFRDPGRNRGVLDGLLDSYPWRGPLSLDFKPFAIQLQGTPGAAVAASPLKTLLPLSSSTPLLPFSRQDAALHTLTLPAARAFSPLGGERLRGLPPLPPLADLPLLSVLQGKKPPHCREPCLHGPQACLVPVPGPLGPRSPASPLPPHLSDPYCLYRYGFPLGPQLAAISRHAKLAEEVADCPPRPSPWHPTAGHCL